MGSIVEALAVTETEFATVMYDAAPPDPDDAEAFLKAFGIRRAALIRPVGQILFFMRFLVQWLMSERRRESVMPVAFWYFSIGGGAILLAYAIYRCDPVFIPGHAFGILV